MSSLEFINKEIQNIEIILDRDDILCLQTDEDYKFWYVRLKMFKQIKIELEAYEIIKNIRGELNGKTLIEIKNKSKEIAKKYEYEYEIKPYYKNDCFGVELNYKSIYYTTMIDVGLSLKIITAYDKLTNETYPISYDEICIAKELIDWWFGEESEVI